jgi:hypothetical protein
MAAKNKTGNVRTYIIFRRIRATKAVVKKTIRLTYSECVSVAFRIRHAIRMHHTVLLSVACLVTLYNFFFHDTPRKARL